MVPNVPQQSKFFPNHAGGAAGFRDSVMAKKKTVQK